MFPVTPSDREISLSPTLDTPVGQRALRADAVRGNIPRTRLLATLTPGPLVAYLILASQSTVKMASGIQFGGPLPLTVERQSALM